MTWRPAGSPWQDIGESAQLDSPTVPAVVYVGVLGRHLRMCLLTIMKPAMWCGHFVSPLCASVSLRSWGRMNSQLPLIPRALEPEALYTGCDWCLGAEQTMVTTEQQGGSIPLGPGGPTSPLSPTRETDTVV